MTCLCFPFPWRNGYLLDTRFIVDLRLQAKSLDHLVRLALKSRHAAYAKAVWTSVFLLLTLDQSSAFFDALNVFLVAANAFSLTGAVRRTLLLDGAVNIGPLEPAFL